MEKFGLCLKSTGEIINICLTSSINEAISYFAIIKRIDSFTLLDIFDVKKIK